MFEKGLLSTGIDYASTGIDKASSTRAQNYEDFANDVKNSQGVISVRNSMANRNIKEEDLFIKLLMEEQGLSEQEARNLAATIKTNYLRGLRHRDTGISTASFGDYNEIYQQSNLKGGGNYVFNLERDKKDRIKGFDRTLLGGEGYIPGTGIKIIKAPKKETGIRGIFDTGAGRTASAVGGDMGISSDIAFTLAQRGIAEEYDPYSIYYRDAVVDDPNTPKDETAAAIDSIRIYDTFQPQEGLDTYAKATTVLDESLVLNSTQFQALADSDTLNATFRNETTGGFGFYQGAINDERMRYRRDNALKYIEPALERGKISPSIIRNYVNDSQAIEDKYLDIDAILNDESLTDVLAQYETRVSIEDKPIGPNDKSKSLSELQKDYNKKVDALNITEDQKTYVKKLFKTDWKEAQKGSLYINKKAEFADYANDIDNIEFKRTQGGFTGTIKSSKEIDNDIVTNNLTPLDLSEYAVNLAVDDNNSIYDPLDTSKSEGNIREQMAREFVRTDPLSEEGTETRDDTFARIGKNIDTFRDQSKLNKSAKNLSVALGANVLSIEEKIKRITPFIDNLNSLSPKVAEKLITSISKFVQTNQDTLDPGYIEYVNSMITQNQEEEDTLVKANIPTEAQGGTILRNIPRFEGGGGIEKITVKGKKLDGGGGRSYGGLGSMSGPRGGYGFSSERLADIRAEENIENRIGEDIKTGMAEGITTEGIMSKPRISEDDHWLDTLDDVRNMPDELLLTGIDQAGDTVKEWGDKQGPAGKFIVKDVLGNAIKSIGWLGRQIKKGTDLPVDTGKILVKKVEEAFDEKKETD